MQTTLRQFSELLVTLYAGLFIGLVYEVFRMLRRIFRAGKWLTALFDLLFWLAVTFVAFVVLYTVNGGEIRVFSMLGFLCGALLFVFGLSPLLRALFQLVTRPFRAIWKYIWKYFRNSPKQEGE